MTTTRLRGSTALSSDRERVRGECTRTHHSGRGVVGRYLHLMDMQADPRDWNEAPAWRTVAVNGGVLSEERVAAMSGPRIFVVVTTFYVHDFWNQSGGSERLENIVHVMKNISIVGALLMIIGYRPMVTPVSAPSYVERHDL